MDRTLIELSVLLTLTVILLAWIMVIVMAPYVRRHDPMKVEVVGYSHDGIRTTPVCSNPVFIENLDSPFYVYVSNDVVILDNRYRDDLVKQPAFYLVVETSLNQVTRVVRSRLDYPINFNYKYGEY